MRVIYASETQAIVMREDLWYVRSLPDLLENAVLRTPEVEFEKRAREEEEADG